MRITAVVPYWPDRPPAEALDVAAAAEAAGYDELWLGEMATYDVFALATAVGTRCPGLSLTIGPLAVHVRTSAGIALGVASVAELTGRRVDVALGTSSDVVVAGWHGRARTSPAATLERAAGEVRTLLTGGRGPGGFRLRLPAPEPAPSVTVAAFGGRALAAAGRVADRVVLNLVTPALAARLRAAVPDRPVAVWVPAAADPEPEAWAQAARGLVAYLAAPGYGEMFAEAGFGDLVGVARQGAHPSALLAALPHGLVEAIGIVGGADAVSAKLAAYADAGIDEVAVVPMTAGDPAGARTLAALRSAAPGGTGP